MQGELDVTRRRKAVLQGIKDRNKGAKTGSDPDPAAEAAMEPAQPVEPAAEEPVARPSPLAQSATPDADSAAPVLPEENPETTEDHREKQAAPDPTMPPSASTRNPKITCHEGPPIIGLPDPRAHQRVAWLCATHKGETKLPFEDWITERENTNAHPTDPTEPIIHQEPGQPPDHHSQPAHQRQRPGGPSRSAHSAAKCRDRGRQSDKEQPR